MKVKSEMSNDKYNKVDCQIMLVNIYDIWLHTRMNTDDNNIIDKFIAFIHEAKTRILQANKHPED
jgi:hypothetical protein